MKSVTTPIEFEQPINEAELEKRILACIRLAHTDYALALKEAEQTVVLAENVGAPGLHFRALMACAQVSHIGGRIAAMERYAKRAEIIGKKCVSIRDRSNYLTSYGVFLAFRHKYTESYAYLTEALDLHRSYDTDKGDYAMTLKNIGIILSQSGEYNEALEYYLKSAAINSSSDNITSLCGDFDNIGEIYKNMGNYGIALRYYRKALRLILHKGPHYIEAYTLFSIGSLMLTAKKPRNALRYLMQAQQIWQRMDSKLSCAESYIYMSIAYELLDDRERAIECAERAHQLLEQYPDERLYNDALTRRGWLYIREGRHKRAITLLNNALDRVEKEINHLFRGDIHELLAEAYENIGDLSQAYKHHTLFAQIRLNAIDEEQQREAAKVELRHALRDIDHMRIKASAKARNAQRQAEHKLQNLLAMAARLTQHNGILQELRNIAEPLAVEGRGESKKLAIAICRKVDAAVESHAERRSFDEQFELEHQEFIAKLREQAPTLTPVEIKTCLLTRLGLAIKEAAVAQFVSTETIRTHRKNIRAKLSLPASANLQRYLETL